MASDFYFDIVCSESRGLVGERRGEGEKTPLKGFRYSICQVLIPEFSD